jgi:corrinoid protein of di/trimethylamine methyltransferase
MTNTEILATMRKLVLDYEAEECETLAREAMDERVDPLQVADTLSEAIKEVGDAFGRGDIFLPELLMAADAVKRAQSVIEEELKKAPQQRKIEGRLLIGTVAGDIHDIGKNIVAALFQAAGFEVIDLGVDVPAEKFIEGIRENGPDIVGLSALLTTTAPHQREIIENLKKEGIRDKVKVIVGGGAITQEFADTVGADGYGANATEGVEIAKRLLAGK